jgi:hypothetical protein
VEGGAVPTEEDAHLDARGAVLEEVGLEQFVVAQDLPAHQVRVLLQPLLVD